jgi:hypothetical protein
MNSAPRVSKFFRNAFLRGVGIGEHPKTHSRKNIGGEIFGAAEDAIFDEKIPFPKKVPNKWFLFAEASADGIINPPGFTFS